MSSHLTPYQVAERAFPDQMRNQTAEQASIRVDDQSPSDFLDGFCTMTATFEKSSKDDFRLELRNVPFNAGVEAMAEELDGEWAKRAYGRCLTMTLTLKQLAGINKLAKAIHRVVGRGARYEISVWKWMAPRAAASLEEFVRKMKEARRSSAA